MNDAARGIAKVESKAEWGSDSVADLLRALEIPYIALTPGASFRGLHDSLVNHLGNTRPELLLCIHEETRSRSRTATRASAGSSARGCAPRECGPDARDDGDLQCVVRSHPDPAAGRCRPARRDEAPAVGRLDPYLARSRRAPPRLHEVGRSPRFRPAALEAILRAYRIAMTEPQGPVYVALDVALQEEALAAPVPMPDLARFRAATPGTAPKRSCAKSRNCSKAPSVLSS
jgi:hypothetical protein